MNTGWMNIHELDERGTEAPRLPTIKAIADVPDGAVARVSIPVGRGLDLEILLIVKKRALPLVVQFHGAIDKSRYAPPRFERLATAKELDASIMFVADPTIMLHANLQLAWYTGWGELDLHFMIGSLINEAASALGASRVVTTGSSGGGFAALQVAPYVSNSIVVTMNPQTAIPEYRVDGIHLGPQRTYRRTVLPELGNPDDQSTGSDSWWHPLADRLSALVKYSRTHPVSIQFWQNVNDTHHYETHYKPFVRTVERLSTCKLETFEYEGPSAHVQPSTDQYQKALGKALKS